MSPRMAGGQAACSDAMGYLPELSAEQLCSYHAGLQLGGVVFWVVLEGEASTGRDGEGKQICKSQGTGKGNLSLGL